MGLNAQTVSLQTFQHLLLIKFDSVIVRLPRAKCDCVCVYVCLCTFCFCVWLLIYVYLLNKSPFPVFFLFVHTRFIYSLTAHLPFLHLSFVSHSSLDRLISTTRCLVFPVCFHPSMRVCAPLSVQVVLWEHKPRES